MACCYRFMIFVKLILDHIGQAQSISQLKSTMDTTGIIAHRRSMIPSLVNAIKEETNREGAIKEAITAGFLEGTLP